MKEETSLKQREHRKSCPYCDRSCATESKWKRHVENCASRPTQEDDHPKPFWDGWVPEIAALTGFILAVFGAALYRRTTERSALIISVCGFVLMAAGTIVRSEVGFSG